MKTHLRTSTRAFIMAAGLTARGRTLADHVKSGKLKIVAARYDLDSGRVTLVK